LSVWVGRFVKLLLVRKIIKSRRNVGLNYMLKKCVRYEAQYASLCNSGWVARWSQANTYCGQLDIDRSKL
jgi:hypothetical protein